MVNEKITLDMMAEVAKRQAEECTGPAKIDSRGHRNCLTEWFPKIRDAGLPVPETHWTRTDNAIDLFSAFDGKTPASLGPLADELRAFGERVGYPLFLRTGQTSGKHNWDKCCYVTDPGNMEDHIIALVEFSEMCGFIGLPFDVWVVRELLPTSPVFHCIRYGGFPVVREFRFFVDGPKVLYRNPYWPSDALKSGKPSVALWENEYEKLIAVTDLESTEIAEMASHAGAAVGGLWSVDILDTNKGWFVTDMAAAEDSYGWDPEKVN